jgi:hypothetical protein
VTLGHQEVNLILADESGHKFQPGGRDAAANPGVVFAKSPLQCAGLNRHEVEDERALRERSSDPLGPESCAATVRDPAKRRQGIGGVGIQLRHIQKRKRNADVVSGR